MNELYLTFKQISIGFFKKLYGRRYIYLSDLTFHYFLILYPLDKPIEDKNAITLDYVIVLWIVNKLYFDFNRNINDIIWLYKVVTGYEISKKEILKREMYIYNQLCWKIDYFLIDEFYKLVK